MITDIYNTDRKYKIIYADPPWEYRQKGSKTKARGMARQHYQTMATEDICQVPAPKIATDDSVCLMWATMPNIRQAMQVMEAWGYTYKTAAFVWVKTCRKSQRLHWGMGAYTRANAELCLLGVSKNTRAGEMVQRHDIHQIIIAPVGEHSEKPPIVRKRIEELFGPLPRIELFARQQAPGWDCWGDQVQEK